MTAHVDTRQAQINTHLITALRARILRDAAWAHLGTPGLTRVEEAHARGVYQAALYLTTGAVESRLLERVIRGAGA